MSGMAANTTVQELQLPTGDAATDLSTARLHGSCYFIFAVELFLLAAAFWSLTVLRQSYAASVADYPLPIFWCLLLIASVGWGWLYLRWSRGATQSLANGALSLLTISAACALITAGILLVIVLRIVLADPDLARVESPRSDIVSEPSSAATSDAITGNPEAGRALFAGTCATCHGPTGEGVANNAPSLRASEFVLTADVAAIAAVIRNGRAVADPANKTGKVMPAKGGNPFLDEAKIADLATFIHAIDDQATASPGESTAPATDLSVLVAAAESQTQVPIQTWERADFADFNIPNGPENWEPGARAFVKANCHKCHFAAAGEKPLGPALAEIYAKKYNDQQLIQHILEPSAEINEPYQNQIFLLADGRVVTGFVATESPQTLEVIPDLLKPADVVRIDHGDIDDQRLSTTSAMPDELLNVLRREEIVQLLAYLRLAGAPPPPQLARWILPAAAVGNPGVNPVSDWDPANLSFGDRQSAVFGVRYRKSAESLNTFATTVIAFHFLWIACLTVVVIAHRDLRIDVANARCLMTHVAFLWVAGVGFTAVWLGFIFLLR